MKFHFPWFYWKKKKARGGWVGGKSMEEEKKRRKDGTGQEGDRERINEFKQCLFPGNSIVATQSSL